MAPLPSCPPPTRGSKKPRLLPEHWVTATSSTGAPNFFQVGQRQFQRRVHQAAHAQPVGGRSIRIGMFPR